MPSSCKTPATLIAVGYQLPDGNTFGDHGGFPLADHGGSGHGGSGHGGSGKAPSSKLLPGHGHAWICMDMEQQAAKAFLFRRTAISSKNLRLATNDS